MTCFLILKLLSLHSSEKADVREWVGGSVLSVIHTLDSLISSCIFRSAIHGLWGKRGIQGPERKRVIWKELIKLGEIKKESCYTIFASCVRHAKVALFMPRQNMSHVKRGFPWPELWFFPPSRDSQCAEANPRLPWSLPKKERCFQRCLGLRHKIQSQGWFTVKYSCKVCV